MARASRLWSGLGTSLLLLSGCQTVEPCLSGITIGGSYGDQRQDFGEDRVSDSFRNVYVELNFDPTGAACERWEEEEEYED